MNSSHPPVWKSLSLKRMHSYSTRLLWEGEKWLPLAVRLASKAREISCWSPGNRPGVWYDNAKRLLPEKNMTWPCTRGPRHISLQLHVCEAVVCQYTVQSPMQVCICQCLARVCVRLTRCCAPVHGEQELAVYLVSGCSQACCRPNRDEIRKPPWSRLTRPAHRL